MSSFADSVTEILSALASSKPRIPTPNSRPFPSGTFAAVVFALLEQSTRFESAQAATAELKEFDQLDPDAIAKLGTAGLRDFLADQRVLRLAAKPAQLVVKLAEWFQKNEPEALATESIREALRRISGLGPATSDAVLMHGFGRPAYPVDRATYRIMVRHGWIDTTAEYDDARSTIESAVSGEHASLALLSAGFEVIGQKFCKAAAPHCELCPLKPFLPTNGPYDPA